jgi:starch synthase (maltosyl-transferring)
VWDRTKGDLLDLDRFERAGRVVIEHLRPEVDAGRFPVKRSVGQSVEVRVAMFADGHDRLAGVLRHRHVERDDWSETPLRPEPNDLWTAGFEVLEEGRYEYTVQGWVDPFATWRVDTRTKAEAGQDIAVELLQGAELVEGAAARAEGRDRAALEDRAETLRNPEVVSAQRLRVALSDELRRLVNRYPDRSHATRYARVLQVLVERERARFSAWYEFFPRSCTDDPSVHGTFRDCFDRLEYVADMGFDVVYLPPIHPIGHTNRKGPNNAPEAGPDDPGSPWAIGSEEGGHDAVHPELGSLDDFEVFLRRARELGMEVALDLAYQCSPDHPWVKEHPEWFLHRPDGTVQYAENPPKKYEDIYPIHFDTGDREALWEGLMGVVRFWIEQGVRIFRVDNPHTKAFPFWEWLIARVKRTHPDVLFLAEAFTGPRKMHRLAKLGFTQSYTYFTWRNTKAELTSYLTELFGGDGREYLRPNLWPNTPDILTEYLQTGGRPAFMARVTLAATAAASYGIYGPAFELCEATPREPGSEEYLHSEKYQIRVWNVDDPESIAPYIARLNGIRRENPALHDDWNLRFVDVDNEKLLAYVKATDDGSNIVLVVVNLDPYNVQSGWIDVPLAELGLDEGRSYQMHDLVSDARYLWYGRRNYVQVDPQSAPAHVFRLRRRVRTERDFDYYM